MTRNVLQLIIDRVSERNLQYALVGEVLATFAIGAYFSIELVQYAYFILIAATILVVNYLNKSFINYKKDKKEGIGTRMLGLIGGYLLVLVFGIQSPQVPFKLYLIAFGVILMLPAVYNLVVKKNGT